MIFDVIQIIYWLALSTWFGGVLFIVLAAPVILRTIASEDPTLPKVLSVNLERQHSTLLASTVIGKLLALLVWIEIGCAAALVVAMVGQWFFIDTAGWKIVPPVVRAALLLAGAVMVLYYWLIVWPKVQLFKQQFVDHADEPEIANPAMDQFERYDAEGVMLLRNILCVLLGIILFSGDIRPTHVISSTIGNTSNASQSK